MTGKNKDNFKNHLLTVASFSWELRITTIKRHFFTNIKLINIKLRHKNENSIRTRIKTLNDSQIQTVQTIKDTFPLEQGLKL